MFVLLCIMDGKNKGLEVISTSILNHLKTLTLDNQSCSIKKLRKIVIKKDDLVKNALPDKPSRKIGFKDCLEALIASGMISKGEDDQLFIKTNIKKQDEGVDVTINTSLDEQITKYAPVDQGPLDSTILLFYAYCDPPMTRGFSY
jgi:hypothetical protein